MKIRSDYVTNSSSSSFILARKGGLTEKQKEKILEYVEHNMLGNKIASTKEELDKYFLETYDLDVNNENFMDDDYYYGQKYKDCLGAIEKGYSVYMGYVSFEGDDSYADVLNDIWEELEEADEDNFQGIDTSLDY